MLKLSSYVPKAIKIKLFIINVLVILSFLMFMIYQLMPNNRAYTDAKQWITDHKQTINPAEIDQKFEEMYEMYQRKYGTDTDNRLVRYLRWVGVYPLYDGSTAVFFRVTSVIPTNIRTTL